MTAFRFIKFILVFGFLLGQFHVGMAQVVAIDDYSVNGLGQVELTVKSSTDHYYILMIRNDTADDFEINARMTLGRPNTTVIMEALSAYPIEHYQVIEHSIETPFDTDGDGIDDITEFNNRPVYNPLNPADSLSLEDGAVILDSFSLFNELSVSSAEVKWSEFLNGKRYAKFLTANFETAPETYFINGAKHNLHADFINFKDIDVSGVVKRGQIVYHPTIVSNNGTIGTFAFNFSDGHGEDFSVLQKTHELLAANMPFLQNNLSYYVTERSVDEYARDSALIAASRIPVVFEEDVFGEIDYWGLNQKEGYGFFREMDESDIPDVKDIVLLNSLPNSLPRVGGIITSVLQTPLSHVNLRAIQDNVPNAFIRDPLEIDSIADLLDHYIYFKVEPDRFIIREASQEEVNAWFETIRPSEVQIPPLNLDFTSILPLSDISFEMYEGFGPKCANVATMRTFDLPDGTVPDGFGVPFYFYQEFMLSNNLFDDVREMLKDESFMSNRDVREKTLEAFGDKIKQAEMPRWMMKELGKMQEAFGEGASIRCRSSTNNEDLPGFNGAGLYDSKTQHPEEGHISKSIKQVYASLWNLRAFDERTFYRVDHFATSMGVLCHPNYTNEIANGVGVSADPVYQTYNSFYYLNTQVGEVLITNPVKTSIPEEILLDKEATGENDYILIRNSNLSNSPEVILSPAHRAEIRSSLTTIHDGFQPLYDALNNQTFAMEIEFKINAENDLTIKQARPWVSYVPSLDTVKQPETTASLTVYPNPSESTITAECAGCQITHFVIASTSGEIKQKIRRDYRSDLPSSISVSTLSPGIYFLLGIGPDGTIQYATKFAKT